MEYYNSLVRLTDNTGLSHIPDRLREFRRMILMWRHILVLKRGGRGHEPGGILATKQGELAILCPLCPHPGINISPHWQKDAKPWKYMLVLAMDANFKLRRLKVSSDILDPSLSQGWAYFVEDTAYRKHLATFDAAFEEEQSTCSGFDALKLVNIRGGKGITVSGVAACICARHDMRQPTSVVNLQKGERYVNMDYAFLSSLKHFNADGLRELYIVLSYDIACQYTTNLGLRVLKYPEELQIAQDDSKIIPLVPKFHLPAHVEKCQENYSFNYTLHVGRTDGEAPERVWSAINALASSTKEMGPGTRRDTLDDHFGDQDWRKVVAVGDTTFEKWSNTIYEAKIHRDAYEDLTAAWAKESIVAWEAMAKAWDLDRNKPNPYRSTISPPTLNKVRLALAEEEKKRRLKDGEIEHPDISPSTLILKGLELEGTQRNLKADTGKITEHTTSLHSAKIVERGNTLQRRIVGWFLAQLVYMPAVALHRKKLDEEGGDQPAPYNIPLFLPSAALEAGLACQRNLMNHEWRLREASAFDALASMCQHLLCRTQLLTDKKRNLFGQRQTLRSWDSIKGLNHSLDIDKENYRTAFKALQLLSPKLDKPVNPKFCPLEDRDVRGLSVDENDGTQGKMVTSWIWKVKGVDLNETEEMDEAVRIEWCKTRSRHMRHDKELTWLVEEMTRGLETFKWQEKQWRRRAEEAKPKDIDAMDKEGQVAYALYQADIRRRMHDDRERKWKIKDNPKVIARYEASEGISKTLGGKGGVINPYKRSLLAYEEDEEEEDILDKLNPSVSNSSSEDEDEDDEDDEDNEVKDNV